MISLDRLREIEPKLKNASDEEVALIREKLYEIGQLAMESYVDECGSKFPVGLTEIDGK